MTMLQSADHDRGFLRPELALVRGWPAQATADASVREHELLLRLRRALVQAAAHHERGEFTRARAYISEAVSIAAPAGARGPSVDGGVDGSAGLGERLSGWAAAELFAGFVSETVVAIAAADRGDEVGRPAPPESHLRPVDAPFEGLTFRELEVLDLLARRLSNKEIAAHLQISAATVKRHAQSIYDKLGVAGRRAAADRAGKLGLLGSTPPPRR